MMDTEKLKPKWQVVVSVIGLVTTAVSGWGLNEYFVPRETHTLEVARLEKLVDDLSKERISALQQTEHNNTLQLIDFRIDYLGIKIDYLAQRKVTEGDKFPTIYQLDLDKSIDEYKERLSEKDKLIQ